MHLLLPDQYVKKRETYNYEACSCKFSIIQTGSLVNIGTYSGIFPKDIPSYSKQGINLRKFENICKEVFQDCQSATIHDSFSSMHLENLKSISSAIIFWKMASQGGRAPLKMNNMLNKWDNGTTTQLLKAYCKRDLLLFKIGGVRIPTASAFLRFLFPEDYGIIDSRVVNNYTQPNKLTNLNLRNDGYINDTRENVRQFNEKYIPFLREEAKWLNDKKITFLDKDSSGNMINAKFRPCDVEMALF